MERHLARHWPTGLLARSVVVAGDRLAVSPSADSLDLANHLALPTPAAPHPLLTQLGRLPAPSMSFPASGAHHEHTSEQTAELPPPQVSSEETARAEPEPEPVWVS